MTNFVLIDPTSKTVQNYDAPTVNDALRAIGLDSHEVDYGSIGYDLTLRFNIIVYEFGLLTPKTDKYFATNYCLFNGPAVVYTSLKENGETTDFPLDLTELLRNSGIIWLNGTSECEAAIEKKLCNRPQTSINGQIVWSWNQPN